MNQLLDVVHVDLNVLGSLMMDQIVRDLNHTLVVTIDDFGLPKGNSKLSENVLKVDDLSSSINNSLIRNKLDWNQGRRNTLK